MIDFSLRRATNIRRQALDVDKSVRAGLKQQRPCVLWFTGLSGAGKSTIANLVDRRLAELGRHATLLDGDNLRHGINRDLGFTSEARVENIRRTAEIAAAVRRCRHDRAGFIDLSVPRRPRHGAAPAR